MKLSSADHERDWPPCKVVFFGLATNALKYSCYMCDQYESIQSNSRMQHAVVVVVFFSLTDRVPTIPSNIRGCQSGTWSAGQKEIRGTSTAILLQYAHDSVSSKYVFQSSLLALPSPSGQFDFLHDTFELFVLFEIKEK